jgi:hypothetical protein
MMEARSFLRHVSFRRGCVRRTWRGCGFSGKCLPDVPWVVGPRSVSAQAIEPCSGYPINVGNLYFEALV